MRQSIKNRILDALAPDDLQAISADLHPVSLEYRQLLQDVGTPLDTVYFIESGLASVLTVMSNAATIETGMIGNEGVVGVLGILGAESSAQQVIVQVPGTALSISTARCRAVFNQRPGLQRVIHRFTEAVYTLTGQTAACNRLHPIEQRMARWLLMSSDRIQSLTMPMTHEFLASMLGVRRVGVTQTAGELQRSGLIQYQRGSLTIIDRDALEDHACECYQLDHARLENLINHGSYGSPAN
jgi:CRP-like cAMP-binding protein